jgi:phosphoribosylanthranilate isomerase
MARIKICGVSTPEIIDLCCALNVEMIGLVFFPKSPRNVSLGKAAELATRTRSHGGHTSVVALLVDPTDDLVRDVTTRVAPDFLQLHGHETPDRVAAIRQISAKPLIKAIPVATAADAATANVYAGHIWLPLFDAKPPKDATLPGGNGVAFDWSILKEARKASPFMLSGGLSAENVRDAIRIADPLYVDVSSGVESAPGIKDAAKVRAFVSAAWS